MNEDYNHAIEMLVAEYEKLPSGDDLAFVSYYERNEQLIKTLDRNEPSFNSLLIRLLGGYGIALQRCGRHTKALKIIPQAIDLITNRINEGDDDQSLQSFLEQIHWSRGVSFYDTGKNEESKEVFEHLTSLQPDNDRYHSWLNATKAARIRKWSNKVWIVAMIWLLLGFSVFELFSNLTQLYLSIIGFALLMIAVAAELYLYLLKNKKAPNTA